ncbi:MAG: hypothetical protein AVDCRST_MAG43-1182 [uncultured Thermomicrobiales bacterium]|uniref:Uncharacterized protein n=1 Tax=uncultured Thermomicrobiales bacterium TaxID=1645740 RepID=A0A6J4UNW8_9BACT|nr:MAG: hypothetical protein AVDCRST_MAG43-1182 [uncultured Thermomicrobiales bacterium]
MTAVPLDILTSVCRRLSQTHPGASTARFRTGWRPGFPLWRVPSVSQGPDAACYARLSNVAAPCGFDQGTGNRCLSPCPVNSTRD